MPRISKKAAKQPKRVLGDAFDVLRGDRSFVTPQMFREKFSGISLDYSRMEIRLDERMALRLVVEE